MGRRFFFTLSTICLIGYLTGHLAGCAKRPLVSITRNEYNLPSITVLKARDAQEADYQVFFHQGFEQAFDRLIQMDVLRRLPQGRLAELMGPTAVEKDILNIGIGFPYAVNQSHEEIKKDPEVMAALVAYAGGVNAFIDQIAARKPDVLRIYRELARNRDYVPERWGPKDSVAMAKAMTFFLSSALEEKLHFGIYGFLNHGFDFTVLPEKLSNQFDIRPIEHTYIVHGPAHTVEKTEKKRVQSLTTQSIPRAAASVFSKMPKTCMKIGYPWPDCVRPGPLGSNNWVVNAQFSGTGANLLANDPHLPLSFPTTFYENGLNSKTAGGTISVAGLNVPGAPGIMIGHNGAMGWGFTNLGADVDDVYFEELSLDGNSVKFGDSWIPLETEMVDLAVRLSSGEVEHRQVKLRWVNHQYSGDKAYRSHRRPLFSDHQPEIKTALDQIETLSDLKYALSYRWVGHEGTAELRAVFAMNRAQTMMEMKSAIELFGVGTQNIVYADRHGNIGYMAHGRFPVRRYLSKEYPPYIPVVGHTDWDWDGYQTEIPQSVNPAKGFIVTANNDPWGDSYRTGDYSRYIAYGFSTGIRASRIETLLNKGKGHLDLDVMKSIQFDHHDLLAMRFIDQLRLLDLTLSPKAAEFSELLKSWNGDSNRKRIEPVIWNKIIQSLMLRHFSSKAISNNRQLFDLEQFIQSPAAVKTLYHKITDGIAGKDTGLPLESVRELWTNAFEDVASLEGGFMGKTWGEVSHMAFTSPLGDIFPSFATFPIERDGTFDTVDVAHGAYGPNFRLVMRLAEDGITAQNVLPGGNYSPTDTTRLYKELLMWRDGKYRDLVSY